MLVVLIQKAIMQFRRSNLHDHTMTRYITTTFLEDFSLRPLLYWANDGPK